jgi:hypothetical protein
MGVIMKVRLRGLMAILLLLLMSFAVQAKPLAPVILTLEPLSPAVLPTQVDFSLRIQATEALPSVQLSYLYQGQLRLLSIEDHWQFAMEAGEVRQFRLQLQVDSWQDAEISAIVRTGSSAQEFTLGQTYSLPSQKNKAAPLPQDRYQLRFGREIRERGL